MLQEDSFSGIINLLLLMFLLEVDVGASSRSGLPAAAFAEGESGPWTPLLLQWVRVDLKQGLPILSVL